MYMNAVTATILEKAYVPIVLPDDLTCIRALVATCWPDGAPRLCQIRSSAHLDTIAVTAPLLEELRDGGHVLDDAPPEALEFQDGRLINRLSEAP